MTTILGIDPGIDGGWGLISDNTEPRTGDLPTHNTQLGRTAKVRRVLDLHTLRAVLPYQVIDHIFIEEVGSGRPNQSSVATFRFGYAAGSVFGLLLSFNIPMTFVRPQVWQKYHGIGPTPDAARQRAVQLFPSLATYLQQKKDHNRADAILIAAYGKYVVTH